MLTRDIGNQGEDIAVKFLKTNRYKIIERNFNVPKLGEIDIVAKDKDYLVFVEVRLRKAGSLVSPLETVDIYKQRKLIKAAQTYLKLHNLNDVFSRFDVVGVTFHADGSFDVEIVKNAFEANC